MAGKFEHSPAVTPNSSTCSSSVRSMRFIDSLFVNKI